MEQRGIHLRNGGGLMGALIRSKDWSQTSLGPSDTWPSSLRIALGICLASRFPMLIWWGPELNVLYNDAYIPILGNKHPRVLGLAGKDAWEEVWDVLGPMLDRVVARGEASWSEDTLLVLRRFGFAEEAYFTWSDSPIFDETGGVGGVFTAVTETTQRVICERRLEQSRSEAIAANHAKDEFLAMLGHELRNPLAPILTALELMRLRGGDLLMRERAIIERQTHHLAAMLEDLLDVSRIARGMIELRRERLPLADVIAKAIETAAPLFEQQRHEVVTEVPRNIAIDADVARMTQVFANLLTNAAKYTDPGGRVTVVARTEAGEVLVTVTDTGRGIAPDMLPRVFELFVQERQNLDRSRGGLGLGLAIVRSLVELHGGRVEVASPGVGHGSTFMVHLPRALDVAGEIETTQTHAAPSAVRSEGRARSVLVVDDNVDAANLLADLLESHGYLTRVAHDGPQVLEFAQDFVPDVALLDIGLPAMDGYELALRLRTLPSWRNVRMLAVTGYGQSSDRTRSAEAGFDHHLVKPISLAMLENLLPGMRA